MYFGLIMKLDDHYRTKANLNYLEVITMLLAAYVREEVKLGELYLIDAINDVNA